MINKHCKEAEEWDEKDIVYVIGVVKGQHLQSLCMVYGTEFCASDDIYLGVREKIKEAVFSTPGIDGEETKEIGRVNKVDPLGITYLRIRGMWGIENPVKVFNYVYTPKEDAAFNFMCIINEDKWKTFTNTQKLINLSNEENNLEIADVKVKDPDNPAKLKLAKLITFHM